MKGDQIRDQCVADAQRAWPDVSVPPDVFWSYVTERAAPGTAPETLHTSDLYLACALARADHAAVAAFERAIMPAVTAVLRRKGFADAAIEEHQQELRIKLFAGTPPQITEYAGRGPLRSWVLIVAVRDAIKQARRHGREQPGDEELILQRALEIEDTEDPALQHVKHSYRDAFRAAFADAVHALTPRERTLLRLSIIDGLNVDQIGAIYSVHRATAARWLERARNELRDQTRVCLARRLGTDRWEADNVLELIASHLDASVERLFASAREPK